MDPAHHIKYLRVARALASSASDLAGLSEPGDAYGNAMAIIAIHSCIAYVDSLCIRFAGFKSGDGDHLRAVDALKEALGERLDAKTTKCIRRILSAKDAASYQGDYYSVEDARKVVKDLEYLTGFAEEQLS